MKMLSNLCMRSKTIILPIVVLMIVYMNIAISNVAICESSFTYAVVNNPNAADRLNLRRAPSQTAESLGRYYNGVTVQVLEDLNNGWVRVQIGNGGIAQGYMMKQYLAYGTDYVVTHATPTYTSQSNAWNLYNSPSKNSSYSVYGYGKTVTLLGFSSDWWHIQVEDVTGYIESASSDFELLKGIYYDGLSTAVVDNPNPSDRLHLRESPSAQSKSLGKYYNGVVVAILAEANDDWLKVRIGSLDGYMMKKYLEINNLSSVVSAQPNIAINNIGGTGLNLRSEPRKSSDSLGLYKNGTKVTIMGLSETWCHVCVEGKMGFMLLTGFDGQIQYNQTENVIQTNTANTKYAIILNNTSMYSTTEFIYENQITSLAPGDVVEVLETTSTWTKVSNGIRVGYVQTFMLSFE